MPKRQKPKPFRTGSAFALLFVAVLLATGIAVWLLVVPFGPSTETFVDLPTGTSSTRMAVLLEHDGVLRSRYAFDLLRLTLRGRLRAGEYRFDHPASAIEVYRRIARGDVYTRAVTVPEGYNIFQIAAAVQAAGLLPASDFLAAARGNTALIADLAGPGARPATLEGFLYPDTYRFSRHTSASTMVATMVHRFRQQTAALGWQPGIGGELWRTVVLASIVEKEVAQPSERPLVASVFTNRLRDSMPLQTDPTVIYAAELEGRYRGTIYASDLKATSAYNTYVHAGLPPGPICNPGLASLSAALHPPASPYLYFVSTGNGHTVFSSTLAEHNVHVAEYRRFQKTAASAVPASPLAP